MAYVWFGDRMVNEVLLRKGHTQVMTIPPNVRYAEREACAEGKGLWGECP